MLFDGTLGIYVEEEDLHSHISVAFKENSPARDKRPAAIEPISTVDGAATLHIAKETRFREMRDKGNKLYRARDIDGAIAVSLCASVCISLVKLNQHSFQYRHYSLLFFLRCTPMQLLLLALVFV